MIRNFRELTRSSSNAGIVGDVDFEERWLSAVLRDRVRCYTSCATIPSAAALRLRGSSQGFVLSGVVL